MTDPTSQPATHTSLFTTVGAIASDIKLAHSVFALPFAILAAFMAALAPTRGTWFVSSGRASDLSNDDAHPFLHPEYADRFWPQFAGQVALVIVAMVFARTCAMLANRLIDRYIDARNPRTAGRAIPSGRLSPTTAMMALLVCGVLFLLVCAGFGVWYGNWWPAILGLPVLVWINAYGFIKRFSVLCHIYLGSSLAISPLAAAIAIDPGQLQTQPALWLLSAMVLCWVAGFDIIYALQDIDIDRTESLHSIPARFGTRGALWISRFLHVLAAAALVGIWMVDERFNTLFALGVGVVFLLLIYEHITVMSWGTSRMAMTFFTINGIISCLLGILGIADLIGAAS